MAPEKVGCERGVAAAKNQPVHGFEVVRPFFKRADNIFNIGLHNISIPLRNKKLVGAD